MGIRLSKLTFKRVIKWSAGAFLVCVALGLLYVFMVVRELKLKLSAYEIRPEEAQKTASILEKGSFTWTNALETYADFAKSRVPLKELREEKKLEKVGSRYLIKDDIELPPIFSNQCARYRCFQNRVPFKEIPSSLWKGLLGIEDYRFLQHKGVDPVSILRALIADIKAMSLVQGGSTLTQQLAKNLFLTNEKRFERKLREVVYALYLERAFSKEEIVTLYFNEIFWGAIGGIYIKGVDMASRVYFGKAPSELDDFEASMLIGLLKGPYYYHPLNHPERLKSRTNVVFNRLRELKLMSADQDLAWSDKKWKSWTDSLRKKHKSGLMKSVYLASKNDQAGLEPFEKFIYYEAVSRARAALSERTEGVDIAVKSAIVSSKCEDLDCPQSFTFYSKTERDRRRALFEERHQVGSVLKPIIYQQLIEEGKSLDDFVSTRPITLKLKSGNWTPNDGDYNGLEEVTLKYAIQKSRNIPLIRAASEVGFEALENRLLDYFPNMLTPLGEYPAQLLGAIELSLNELSKAYLKFLDRQCQDFKSGKSSYEDSLIYFLAQAEETTISRVAGDVIRSSLIFGKTGTTNNGLDNWYIAFDGQNFYATWFGVDSQRAGKKLRLYGSNSAFRIFQNFIQYRGKQVSEFVCE